MLLSGPTAFSALVLGVITGGAEHAVPRGVEASGRWAIVQSCSVSGHLLGTCCVLAPCLVVLLPVSS